MKKRKLGKQPQRHYFFLNPYQDARFTRCPKCEGKTRVRKFPLAVHVEPLNPVLLNKTCRYCPSCDLIIAHQDEVEAMLHALFSQRAPEVVGNEYLIMGTMDRAVWRQARKTPLPASQLLQHLYVFKDQLLFEPVHYGWVKEE